MAGQYQNDTKTMLMHLQSWYESVNKTINSWEANYVYLDEIKGLSSLKRNKWIEESIKIYNILVEKFNYNQNNIPCLCFPLKMENENIDIMTVSREWLQENLNEFTPPVFFYSSLNYYDNYYLKLKKSVIDSKSLSEIKNYDMRYSSQFDNLEDGFVRFIYIFNMKI